MVLLLLFCLWILIPSMRPNKRCVIKLWHMLALWQLAFERVTDRHLIPSLQFYCILNFITTCLPVKRPSIDSKCEVKSNVGWNSYLTFWMLGCISLAISKNGLLREITQILFCQRNKESEKRLIADSFLRKKRKIQKRIFPGLRFTSAKTACLIHFFKSFPKETQKRRILRIRIQINPLEPLCERIHWIHYPFLDFIKETKNPF